MFFKYSLRKFISLFCLILFFSCAEKIEETPIKKETVSTAKDSLKAQKIISKQPPKISENSFYKAADRLNVVLFGKKLKYFDFTIDSKKIPLCTKVLDFDKLVNIRAYKEARFNQNYIPNYLDNYVYFIYEFPSKEITQQRLQQFMKESSIMGKVAVDEIDLDSLPERQDHIFKNSKHGGIVFQSKQHLIYIKEDCNTPNTKAPMKWSTYEKVFLNSFEHNKKDSIAGTGCGFYEWSTYVRE